MNIHLDHKTYTSAQEILDARRHVRSRLFPPVRPKQMPNVAPAEVVVIRIPDQPEWKRVPCMFNHHVMQYYRRRLAELKPSQAHIRRRARELGINIRELMSASRKKSIVRPRQLLMWEVKNLVNPSISWSELGNLFGRKDHSTALHGVRTIQAMKDRGEID